MKTWLNVLRMLMRLLWLVGLALGLYLWTGHGYSVLRAHIALGFCITLLLLMIAISAAIAGVSVRRTLLALIWAALLPVVGFAQLRWMIGPGHWLVQVMHLLIGLMAIASAETMGAQAIRRTSPASVHSIDGGKNR
jgi:hypothetical protein